ncbi:MAG: Asp23/Gls24 family envelope stress response protein [Firmicutes bacterium]|nr:Asp23/Gls24 family envelope stress response protein [Alicyclobacillaceae bacterium]MCL6496426.1 Asp23/Gls24 family envelope stress response protein [Bacillota bacterium]
METETGWGKLAVHPEVLAELAADAVARVATGFRLAPGEGGVRGLLQRGEGQAVTVEETAAGARVHLHVAVEYGQRMVEIGRVVGRTVEEAFQRAVGQGPCEVVVHVTDVYLGPAVMASGGSRSE